MPIRHTDCDGAAMLESIASEMRKPCLVTIGRAYYTVVAPLAVIAEFDRRAIAKATGQD